MQLDLDSPILSLEFEGLSQNEVILYFTLWFVFWLLASIGLVWVYAFWFASVVGFESALLVGIALIALSVQTDQ